jgi:RNA polymerase primary sigma factor
VAGVSYPGSDPGKFDGPDESWPQEGPSSDAPWQGDVLPVDAADPFDDGLEKIDVEGDAKITALLERAYGKGSTAGRENLTALSALAQQMQAFKPLSPADQEKALVAYNQGLEAQAKLAARKRSGRETEKLRVLVRDGERAQEQLVGGMFRLTMIIARELATDRYGKERSLTLMEDLVAEANLALVEALPRYDAARCPTFSVYAGRVIRDRVRASLTQSSALQVPSAWLRVKRIAATRVPELASELGRTPTLEEIQDALRVRCMDWAADHLTDPQKKLPLDERQALMRAKLVKQGMFGAIDRYEEVMRYTQITTSLDAPVGDDPGSTYGDFIEAPSADEVYDEVELNELRSDIAKALSTLSDRERDIILHRFGWVDGESWTYAKLAPRYGVSAERVRQIEANVLGKLRGPSFTRLASYLPSFQEEAEKPPTGGNWGNTNPPKPRPGREGTQPPRGP